MADFMFQNMTYRATVYRTGVNPNKLMVVYSWLPPEIRLTSKLTKMTTADNFGIFGTWIHFSKMF